MSTRADVQIAVDGASAGCCGGPAVKNTDACCAADETAKAQGEAGCGCSSGLKTEQVAQEKGSACCGAAA